MSRRLAALAMLSTAGCTANAVLEVELSLPEAEPCGRFAVVQVRSGSPSFRDAWSSVATVEAFELGDVPGAARFSVVAEEAHEEQPLRMKVRFCATEACDAPAAGECDADTAAPEAWVQIERAFYLGAFTRVRLTVDGGLRPGERTGDGSTGDLVVTRCEVEGCAGGETATWCYGEGLGPHFCE